MSAATLPNLDVPTLAAMQLVRKPLLLMAYECMPNRGSEAYVGWGRVMQAAGEFEVHVIVSRESSEAIGEYLATHPIPGNIHFYTPDEDLLYRILKRGPKLFAYNYVAYRHWQKLAYRLARQLHLRYDFALVHQVNVCTFREPGFTWQLGIPYIWGPMGGTQNFPKEFLDGLPFLERMKEQARSLTNSLALRKRRVRAAAQHAAVVLAANSTNQRDCEEAFGRPVELLLETGLYSVHPPDTAKFRRNGPLHILWSGEFTTRKALPLLLEALGKLGDDIDFRLRILGKGPLELKWKRMAEHFGIAHRCEFLGQQPLAQAIGQLEWAHVLVFTSLRDTSGNVVLEALSHGVPVICFDHQGVGDMVTPASGIKIPVNHPEQAIESLSRAVRSLGDDRGRLLMLSCGACARAREFLWAENGARINSIYWSLAGARRRQPHA